MYKLTCEHADCAKVYDKSFETAEDMVEFLEDELATDAGNREVFRYTLYKQEWVPMPWQQKVVLL